MLARVKARSLCLYACDARRCPVPRAGEHGGKTEGVSALQLRALRGAGAHLLRLRPRQPVLRGGVRPDPPARVVVARRGTLPVELPRSVWARRPAACLARAPSAESDASGFPSQRRAGHSGDDLNADDPGDPCRHCIDSALSAPLQFLLACTAALRAAGRAARRTMRQVTHHDSARARSRDPAPASHRALAHRYDCHATSRASQHRAPRARPGWRAGGAAHRARLDR